MGSLIYSVLYHDVIYNLFYGKIPHDNFYICLNTDRRRIDMKQNNE